MATVSVAGHRGLVGSAICHALEPNGYRHLVGAPSNEFDIRDRAVTSNFVRQNQTELLMSDAAISGDVPAHFISSADFLSDNLRIQINLLDKSTPDGTPRKLVDLFQRELSGWRPRIGLRQGLAASHSWCLENNDRRPVLT